MAKTYNRNFFTVLTDLSEKIIVKGCFGETLFEPKVREAFNCVLNFVTDCSWSDAKSVKFICKYYMFSDAELQEYWNALYGAEKSLSTFRVQRRDTSALVQTILCDASTLETAFLSNNMDKIVPIIAKVRVLTSKDVTMSSIFSTELQKELFKLPVSLTEYSFGDCKAEIDFLMGMSQENVERVLKNLDTDKLSFICRVLQEPVHGKGGISKRKQAFLEFLASGGMKSTVFEKKISELDLIKSCSVSSTSSTDEDYKTLYLKEKSRREELEEQLGSMTATSVGDMSFLSGFGGILSGVVEDGEGVDLTTKTITDEEKSGLIMKTFVIASMYDFASVRSLLSNCEKETLSKLAEMFKDDDSSSFSAARECILGDTLMTRYFRYLLDTMFIELSKFKNKDESDLKKLQDTLDNRGY